MNQKPALCCPTPAVKNGLHPHSIPTSGSSVTSANTELVELCTPEGDKVFVQFDTSTIAPVALSAIFPSGERYEGDLALLVDCDALAPAELSLDGEDCTGAAVPVTGKPGELTHVIQAPGTVFTVKLCEEDRDFELSCGVDPATDHQIQTAYKITNGEFILIKRWDTVTGEEWTGDPTTLEGCGGKPLEADPREMCDNGVQFIRWYTIESGIPTGQYVDTDNQGQPYEVSDEANVVPGACVAQCADIVIRDCNGAALGYGYSPTLAPIVGATVEMTDCTGGAVYGYIMAEADKDHTIPVTLGCGTGATVCGYAAATGCEKPAVDVETQVMCDAGTSFVRTFVYEDGALIVKRDHTMAGLPYTVTDEAAVKVGACVADACEQSISSAPADTLAGLLPGTSISVQKSNCCAVRVTTDVGSFIVSKDVTGYSTGDFKCPITVTGVEVISGTCSLADIIITTQKSILV